ncbi:hypothetical protein STCU_11102 [Strigomonas culicis]|uniref:Uncharacterized protein n=1 Tax=Strigomonas culicis TaxID=28005 RepID=S9TF09_9TRYP|nr:hypothetical protein STCU_11102 [Strigomonas culicis]|eukprot:EPY16612.1 hypothetical protein STCU_11102 [Strigomonas culicis]
MCGDGGAAARLRWRLFPLPARVHVVEVEACGAADPRQAEPLRFTLLCEATETPRGEQAEKARARSGTLVVQPEALAQALAQPASASVQYVPTNTFASLQL